MSAAAAAAGGSGPHSVPPPNKLPDPSMTAGGGGAGGGAPVIQPNAAGGHMQVPLSQATDGHFMQQQSQIFVFSTNMANEAAEMVRAGQYGSMREFHMDQPSTKQFLQVRHSQRVIIVASLCRV